MIYLTNLEGEKLSRGIRNLSPIRYESIQIKNKLLDGSYHIQTIGDPLKYITFEILSNHEQVNKINTAEYKGEELKLVVDDRYYIGMLNNELDWNRITIRHKDSENTHYTSSVRLNVTEEGTV